MGKTTLTLAAFVLLGFGAWKLINREPADITEEQAKAKADETLLDFCLSETQICPDFILKATEPSADARFHWAFRFENAKTDPARRMVISVGKKGDFSAEFTTFVPEPVVEEPPVEPAPAQAAPAEVAPVIEGEAPQEGVPAAEATP